jgi:hypothetical protein
MACAATLLASAGCNVGAPSGGGGSTGEGGDAANAGPIAEVEADELNAALGSRVTLDATASHDPDGGATTCHWQQTDGPATVKIETAPGNDCEAYVVPTMEGVYQFVVTVTDTGGGFDSQTVEVRVGSEHFPTGAPMADAGEDQTLDEGSEVRLGGGNSIDPDGDSLGFQWAQRAGPGVSLSSTSVPEPRFTAPSVDEDTELVFELTVDDGVQRSSDTVTIVVLELNVEAPASESEPISTIAANVSQTPIFDEGMWDVSGAPLTNGSVVGDAGGELWFMAPSGSAPPASFTWTGHVLDEDVSVSGLADGVFLSGGALTIEGQLWDLSPSPQLLYEGLILEATVSGFRVTESGPNTNLVDLDGEVAAVITPTGGYLVGNGVLEMAPVDYFLDATGQGCRQAGDDLEDWGDSPVSCDLIELTIARSD